jgi:hypothetical protein
MMWKPYNFNEDCAHANRLLVLAEVLDVILKTSSVNDNTSGVEKFG